MISGRAGYAAIDPGPEELRRYRVRVGDRIIGEVACYKPGNWCAEVDVIGQGGFRSRKAATHQLREWFEEFKHENSR